MHKLFLLQPYSYSIKKILTFYVTWWIIWAIIQTIVLHRLELSWRISLIDSAVSNGLLALACFVYFSIFYYYQPSKDNRIYRFVFALGISITFCISLQWTLGHIITSNNTYLQFLSKSIPVRFIFSLAVLTFITLLIWMWNILQEQKEIENRRNEAEQLVKMAELSSLKQQLQPHFLFNSLNSISALAGSKPNEARKMIQQLSDFLRGTLSKGERKIVLLKEELEHLNLYLEIEKVRFGHRLNIEINFDEESLTAEIPPLLIQPLVENAIKFGLYDTIDEVTISITSFINQSTLYIQVKNPFDSKTQLASQGTGFGLNSIQRRLVLLYARNDLMHIEKQQNIFISTLKIPQAV